MHFRRRRRRCSPRRHDRRGMSRTIFSADGDVEYFVALNEER